MSKAIFISKEYKEFEISEDAARLFVPKNFLVDYLLQYNAFFDTIPSEVLEFMILFAEEYTQNPYMSIEKAVLQ